MGEVLRVLEEQEEADERPAPDPEHHEFRFADDGRDDGQGKRPAEKVDAEGKPEVGLPVEEASERIVVLRLCDHLVSGDGLGLFRGWFGPAGLRLRRPIFRRCCRRLPPSRFLIRIPIRCDLEVLAPPLRQRPAPTRRMLG